ncbi:BspA family leucine-rich repeat surface protein [Candidatus Saccharibacteria bacterium]|nr:BspA family leucine-rich repeat surface protein [Candidatus Saccharibacteria bacterium]
MYKQITSFSMALFALTFLSGLFLTSPTTSASSSGTVNVSITVPSVCSLSITDDDLAQTIYPGTDDTIGTSHLKALCNDGEGLAIYAIGYTGNINGDNNLRMSGTDNLIPSSISSADPSRWNMKVSHNTAAQGNLTATISDGTNGTEDFTNYHIVPSTNTKIASYPSTTDQTIGANLDTEFYAYVAPNQPAGTYEGKVKFTLVHPSSHAAPPGSMLDTGANVNIKMKSLASGAAITSAMTSTGDIKAIHTADSLPEDFEPTEANTISLPDAKYPVYIFFDNTDNLGIMYVYTEGDTVVMSQDSDQMFRNNTSLSDISGLADWDASWVESMVSIFARDTSLTSVSALANWDTSSLTNLAAAFGFTRLTSLSGLENWDVSNVTQMYNTFTRTQTLSDISALANWDTSSVENMNQLFYENQITDLTPLANWDVSNVTSMQNAFVYSYALTSLHGLEEWDTKNVTSLATAFCECPLLTDISALENWDTSKVEDMSYLFYESKEIADASALANWNTSNVTNMAGMFQHVLALTSINVSNWDTSNVTNMASMFAVGESWEGNGQLTTIIGLENWDVSNVTNMTSMFYGAGQMTSYPGIKNWNVSKVESMNHMFCDNFKLESLDLSRWDVSSVKTMWNMFNDAKVLTTIGDVSHWNTASLIDAGGFLTRAAAFVGDNGTLDLSGWNTSNVKDMTQMFMGCSSLQVIDLSGWNFDTLTNEAWDGAGEGIYYAYSTGMRTTFKNTTNLQTVYISQPSLNSYNAAISRGVEMTDQWSGSNISSFTIKP